MCVCVCVCVCVLFIITNEYQFLRHSITEKTILCHVFSLFVTYSTITPCPHLELLRL